MNSTKKQGNTDLTEIVRIRGLALLLNKDIKNQVVCFANLFSQNVQKLCTVDN